MTKISSKIREEMAKVLLSCEKPKKAAIFMRVKIWLKKGKNIRKKEKWSKMTKILSKIREGE